MAGRGACCGQVVSLAIICTGQVVSYNSIFLYVISFRRKVHIKLAVASDELLDAFHRGFNR